MRGWLSLVAVTSIVFMVACSQSPLPGDLLNEMRGIGRKDRIAIGWLYQQHELNVIVLGEKPEMRRYSIATDEAQKIMVPREQPAKISDGTDAFRSPDGRWITYRSKDDTFVLADANGRLQRTLISGRRVLTPLQWSPDSKYLLYVQKGGAWDTAALRCGDDVFYVMVYRLSDGRNGSVLQGCQGYPYWELQWIRVPANLPV